MPVFCVCARRADDETIAEVDADRAHFVGSAIGGGERWFDRLVVQSGGPDATVLVDIFGCASNTLQVGSRRPIQLSQS